MGVMGAFVFAAQMVNFPVLPGTSGHLGGAVLLAILFGPFHASILMASILIVQCLIFQDGGLLALGANILNMGIVPAFVGAALYQMLAFRRPFGRAFPGQQGAAFMAAWLGVLSGALLVPFQVVYAGVTSLPLGGFLAVMIGVHAVIGLAEGLITVAVLKFIKQLYPLRAIGEHRMGASGAVTLLLVVALLIGGGLSIFASGDPDGLEKAVAMSGHAGPEQAGEADPQQTKEPALSSPLPDYTVPGVGGVVSTALAGLTGTLGCFAIVLLLSYLTGRAR